MPKKSKRTDSDEQIDPAEAQRRMDDAVRRMLSTKPETHEEMVSRRRKGRGGSEGRTPKGVKRIG